MSDHRRVLLVTSWGGSCGIANHSAMLKAAAEAADPDLEIIPSAEALDPEWLWKTYDLRRGGKSGIDLVCLNHHDGLHSRWEALHVLHLQAQGIPVVVIYHDTRERLVDCPKLQAFYAADTAALVIHEPVQGLSGARVHYWRQGVPAPAAAPVEYIPAIQDYDYPANRYARIVPFKAFPQQPVLGTCGFHFPWKNFDRLARETRETDWALVILSNDATQEAVDRWRQLNPSTLVVTGFLSTPTMVNYLAGCDATAFMYECANTGTSGAIRLGIAARKPVIAPESCRQFRDLFDDDVIDAIAFVSDWGDFREQLRGTPPRRYDPMVHALAEQDSWTRLGGKYADLYRQVLAR